MKLCRAMQSDNSNDHGKQPYRNTDATDQTYGHCAQTPKDLHRSYLKKKAAKRPEEGYYRGINEMHPRSQVLRED
jgi:hypothetical protein